MKKETSASITSETSGLTTITLFGRLKLVRGVVVFIVLTALAPVIFAISMQSALGLFKLRYLGLETERATWGNPVINEVSPQLSQIRVGDRLVAINGYSTPNLEACIRASSLVGDEVEVVVSRDGEGLIRQTSKTELIVMATRSTFVLRLVTGALLFLIAVASFLLKPGARVVWRFYVFAYALAVLILLFTGEANGMWPGILLYSQPALVLVSMLGLYFFAEFPRRALLFERYPRSAWVPGVLGAAVIGLHQYSYEREYSALGELACRTYSLLVIVSMVILVVSRWGRARGVQHRNSQDVVVYRLLAYATIIGLFVPVLLSSAIRLLGLPTTLFELSTTPVIVFVAMIAYAIVRYNPLEADRYTISVLGYSFTLGLIAVAFGGLLTGLPAVLSALGVASSSEALIGITAVAVFSFGPLYRAIKRRVDRAFRREEINAQQNAEIMRSLIEQVHGGTVDDGLKAVARAAMNTGAECAEVWKVTEDGNSLQLMFRAVSLEEVAAASSDNIVEKNSRLYGAILSGVGGVSPLAPNPFGPEAQNQLWQLGLAMVAPIRAHGTLAGFLGVARKTSGARFSLPDQVFLNTVALEAKVAIERSEAVQQVGRYRIEKRLNIGGTAEVFLARQLGMGGFEKRVALKRLLPEMAQDKATAAMLLDEARITAQLNHRNIVQVYEVGEESGNYFIAMELLEGATLRQLITASKRENQPVPLPIFLTIAQASLHALHYAHHAVDGSGKSLGVVHRDVTPANIMVTKEGTVKLLDFGIAVGGDRLYRTAADAVRGTIPYMSFEQVTKAPMDARSDLYSAAATLFELLTLRRAFEDGPSGKRPLAASKTRREVPEAVDAVFDRAFDQDMANRQATCLELSTALEAAFAPVTPVNDLAMRTWYESFATALDFAKNPATAARADRTATTPLAAPPKDATGEQ